jgi:hypothetical protein
MAMLNQIRDAMHRQPFRPFTLYLVDGRTYLVRHPDFIAIPMSPRGRDITVHDAEGSHMIDMALIVEVHVPDLTPASTIEGSGIPD